MMEDIITDHVKELQDKAKELMGCWIEDKDNENRLLYPYDMMTLDGDVILMCYDIPAGNLSDPATIEDSDIYMSEYREFYRKYSEDYNADSILSGSFEITPSTVSAEGRLAVISILIGRLNSEAGRAMDIQYAKNLFTKAPDITISEIRAKLKSNLTLEERRGLQFSAKCISEGTS